MCQSESVWLWLEGTDDGFLSARGYDYNLKLQVNL